MSGIGLVEFKRSGASGTYQLRLEALQREFTDEDRAIFCENTASATCKQRDVRPLQVEKAKLHTPVPKPTARSQPLHSISRG